VAAPGVAIMVAPAVGVISGGLSNGEPAEADGQNGACHSRDDGGTAVAEGCAPVPLPGTPAGGRLVERLLRRAGTVRHEVPL
jgi:hypothetical protein